jgi:AraC family L-rhamnose operon transcriptional activator RhaR
LTKSATLLQCGNLDVEIKLPAFQNKNRPHSTSLNFSFPFFPVSLPRYELLLGAPVKVAFNRKTRNRLHRHDFFEPCYVVSGRGDFYHGDQHFSLRSGDLFLAMPGVFHEITSLDTRDLRLVYTTFALAEVAGKSAGDTFQDQTIWRFLKGHQLMAGGQRHMAGIFQCLFSLMKSSSLANRPDTLNEYMRLLVLQIMAALSDSMETRAGMPHSGRLESALRQIDIRLSDPLPVGELAGKCGMSERSLCRLFHDKLGRSVSAEIQERRIRKAVSLLPVRELTIANIGEQIGIPDPGQFSRLFKKIVGISPRDFRNGGRPAGAYCTRISTVGEVQMRTEAARNQSRSG